MKKLLLVDDEISMFQVIKHLIKKFSKDNYIVDYAPDGEKGLSLFNKNNYDLIITDFNMPLMNGIEMIKEIRKINNNIPIYLITGNKEVMMEEVTVIYKPFDTDTIKNIIK